MAMKDWEKVENSRNRKLWVNENTKGFIMVKKTTLGKEWEVVSNRAISDNPPIRSRFFTSDNRSKNRTDALKFARKYMRNN